MKNRRNIIESELPPQNPFDIWMKDGKFYKSTNKGWVLIENQMEFTNSKLMSKSTATSGTIGVNKETGRASIYNDVAEQWSPLGGGVTETTWQELKDKRDAGKLTPGALYRITDYQCTTTQENTRSAGHQFDIVLLALSENKLAEEGWAMMNESNIYDVTFSDGSVKCYYNHYQDNEGDWHDVFVNVDTLLGFDNVSGDQEDAMEPFINETNKTIDLSSVGMPIEVLAEPDLPYNYFQNSNLSAWKVWYCLDNDTARFAWADDSISGNVTAIDVTYIGNTYERDNSLDGVYDGIQLYSWRQGSSYIGTEKLNPSVGDYFYNYQDGEFVGTADEVIKITIEAETPNGRGVIYRLIDEWNNDVGYDFKNIQVYLPIVDGEYVSDGEKTWVYTFCLYNSDEGIYEDGSLKRIEVSVDDIYAIFSNNIMVPNLQVNRYFSIPFNLLLGYYSIKDKDAYSPTECNFFNCNYAIVQHASNVYLYNCKMRDYVVEVRGIYYNTKKVLTES